MRSVIARDIRVATEMVESISTIRDWCIIATERNNTRNDQEKLSSQITSETQSLCGYTAVGLFDCQPERLS